MRSLRPWQVAKRIGCCTRYVAKLVDSGKLPGYRLPGSNERRVLESDLIKFLERYKVKK